MPAQFRIIISPEASTDLAALHAFISQDSKQNAARMVESILGAIEALELAPHRTVLARQSRKLKHPVRRIPVKPYVVYFRVLD